MLGEIIARARSFGFGKEAAEFWTRLADLLKTNAGEAERALLQAIEVDPENLETLLRLVRIELEVEDRLRPHDICDRPWRRSRPATTRRAFRKVSGQTLPISP